MTFERIGLIPCLPGKSVEIAYTLTGADNDTQLECIEENGWKAELHSTSLTAGYLRVTAPTPAKEGKVTVLLSNNLSNTLRYTLNFIGGFFEVKQSLYEINFSQQQITVEIETNLPYTISVPAEETWIVPPTDTETAGSVLRFSIAENTGTTARRAKVDFLYEGEPLRTIEIVQMPIPTGDIIKFADTTLEEWLVQRYDTNGDGALSYEEAAAVTKLATDFPRTITSFDEFRFFEGVTEIEYGTFEGCKQLKSICLPNGIVSIGTRAFQYCSQLETVGFPESLNSIGDWAFNETSLKKFIWTEKIKHIGDGAFQGCDLQSIAIPDNIETISPSTFRFCRNLRELKLPKNLQNIGEYAFAGCSALSAVNLPASLLEIGASAFSDCISLISISLPENIKIVNRLTYSGCTSLKQVVLPDGLQSIQEKAFKNCIQLSEITIPSQVSVINDSPFEGCFNLYVMKCLPINPPRYLYSAIFNFPENMKIYVPAASVAIYKTNEYWVEYTDRIFPLKE